ncbi:hypothetical protein J3459_010936 [Metarhizium acridum]|nr:hypothetical protein J3459_010936 [Metarhizium acridum]
MFQMPSTKSEGEHDRMSLIERRLNNATCDSVMRHSHNARNAPPGVSDALDPGREHFSYMCNRESHHPKRSPKTTWAERPLLLATKTEKYLCAYPPCFRPKVL